MMVRQRACTGSKHRHHGFSRGFAKISRVHLSPAVWLGASLLALPQTAHAETFADA
jgi:hypothetical protein